MANEKTFTTLLISGSSESPVNAKSSQLCQLLISDIDIMFRRRNIYLNTTGYAYDYNSHILGITIDVVDYNRNNNMRSFRIPLTKHEELFPVDLVRARFIGDIEEALDSEETNIDIIEIRRRQTTYEE